MFAEADFAGRADRAAPPAWFARFARSARPGRSCDFAGLAKRARPAAAARSAASAYLSATPARGSAAAAAPLRDLPLPLSPAGSSARAGGKSAPGEGVLPGPARRGDFARDIARFAPRPRAGGTSPSARAVDFADSAGFAGSVAAPGDSAPRERSRALPPLAATSRAAPSRRTARAGEASRAGAHCRAVGAARRCARGGRSRRPGGPRRRRARPLPTLLPAPSRPLPREILLADSCSPLHRRAPSHSARPMPPPASPSPSRAGEFHNKSIPYRAPHCKGSAPAPPRSSFARAAPADPSPLT